MSSTAHPPSSQTRKSAPLGIKLICILGVIAAILTLFVSFRLLGTGGPLASLGLLFIVLTFAYLVVIYGLWTVQPWGWTWGMLVFGFGALMDLFQLDIIGLLISIVIIGYLFSKKDYYRS